MDKSIIFVCDWALAQSHQVSRLLTCVLGCDFVRIQKLVICKNPVSTNGQPMSDSLQGAGLPQDEWIKGIIFRVRLGPCSIIPKETLAHMHAWTQPCPHSEPGSCIRTRSARMVSQCGMTPCRIAGLPQDVWLIGIIFKGEWAPAQSHEVSRLLTCTPECDVVCTQDLDRT